MQLREQLERVIHRSVRTADDAEAVQQAAELLGEILRVEDRARRLLHEEPRGDRRLGSLNGLPLHDAAQRVLEEAQVPLHVKELGRRIKAGGWRHPRSSSAQPQQIFFQLAGRLPKHPETFRRVAPNTFGLVRWETEARAAGRRRPRTGLFAGDGSAVGQAIGESDDHVTGEGSHWRSS